MGRTGDHRRAAAAILIASAIALLAAPGVAADLEHRLGRSEVRVRSAPYPLVAGRTVAESALVERLDRLGYVRVREQPRREGRYFYGHEVFWIYRHAHRWNGRDHAASLIGLRLRRRDGMILGALDITRRPYPLERSGTVWLEPEVLSESLDGGRADRSRVRIDELPEHVWRAVLAAEDARFFEHSGVDARSVARAALENVKQGKVAQGGSTITQQLIKNRDLTPRRSLGRKASEAARALLLEAQYDKREILQGYLNHLYYGHVDGLAIHGIDSASRTYFSRPASGLTLAQSALLAAMIQGPNRLSPLRHADRARVRRDWVLGRMEQLGWAAPETILEARSSGLGLRPSAPTSNAPGHFMSWVAEEARSRVPRRLRRDRGVVVETSLDPYLQQVARRALSKHLEQLRRRHARLRERPLSAALVALDARNGEVLAYVGGDPAAGREGFDRARMARRQPGSTVKPLVLLEAFGDCGDREPLHPASRVADEPLRIDLPSGPWEPENFDRRYLGVLDVRSALVDSRNVPLVRVARWCGLEPTASLFRRAGLELPPAPPPSFVLGSVETTPLRLAGAFTTLATPGKRFEPYAVRRIERPGGRPLSRTRPTGSRISRAATAYLVSDVMQSAVERGTARGARIDGLAVSAKTGSSSDLRDAWLAGHAGSVVTVVWVGLDDGSPLGLSGATAAAPPWREFMATAVPARPGEAPRRPRTIVEAYVDPQTGLRVRASGRQARKELFRREALPPRARFWRIDRPGPVIR